MSSRNAVRMSEDEVARFLAAPRTLNVATVGADGAVHLVAMWYLMQDGCPVFTTYGKSQKAANLRRDPRLTAMVEAGEDYASLRGVELIGTAELIEDPDVVLELVRAIGAHYGPRGAGKDPARAAAKRIGVRLIPQRVISWDHAKLAAARE